MTLRTRFIATTAAGITARLAILPGLTHYNVFSSPVLAATVMPFLDAPMPGAK
jgi:hypothetical protein